MKKVKKNNRMILITGDAFRINLRGWWGERCELGRYPSRKNLGCFTASTNSSVTGLALCVRFNRKNIGTKRIHEYIPKTNDISLYP